MPIQELPPPHMDIFYLETRFRAYYYTPHGEWEIIEVLWNTRQHRVVFIDGKGQSITIPVEREFQVTLMEVLESFGIIPYRVEAMDTTRGTLSSIKHLLHHTVEQLVPQYAWIWSYNHSRDMDIQSLPEKVIEAMG